MIPQASRHLLSFGQRLRAQGFLAPPDRGILFLEASRALGPQSIQDIRRAALAVYGPGPERRPEFDALFNQHFLGHFPPSLEADDTDEEAEQSEDLAGPDELLQPEEINDAGSEATRLEISGDRQLQSLSDERILHQFLKAAPQKLPQRITRRRFRAKTGNKPDMRRALRQAVKYEGELLDLPWQKRKRDLRPIVVLIDVSGSMKDYTDPYFQFAHSLKKLPGRVEIFTLGTALTRVTTALSIANKKQALEKASSLVPDWDGGTRLGDVLSLFLQVPRYTSLLRGAFVITLSDGLERGSPEKLVAATRTISRLSWRHLWLTPLSDSQAFEPETEALRQIKPYLDGVGSSISIPAICHRMLNWSDQARPNHIYRRTEYET